MNGVTGSQCDDEMDTSKFMGVLQRKLNKQVIVIGRNVRIMSLAVTGVQYLKTTVDLQRKLNHTLF